MKKSVQIFCLLMLMSTLTIAQRSVDVNTILMKPAKGDIIYKNVSFFIRIDFKNESTTSMLTGDTIYFQFKIFNQPIGQQDLFKLPNDVASGETYNFMLPSYGIGFSSGAENTPFCVETSIINRSDPITDPNAANNAVCNNVNLRMSVSMDESTVVNQPEIYPNPAKYIFFVKTEENKSKHAQLTLTDLSGKECFNTDFETYNGISVVPVELPQLANGVYILQIKTDNQVFTKQIIINQ